MKNTTGIILAYDKSVFGDEERDLLEELAPFLDHVKVGLETMTAEHPESRRTIASLVAEFCRDVLDIGIMWDMKLHDIGNTVGKAAANIGRIGADFFTLHACASDKALEAAAKAAKESRMTALAVTVLTDLDEPQCLSRFHMFPRQAVLAFAKQAADRGITGIVCSPQELQTVLGNASTAHMRTVIPGVRPTWAAADDQKRVMTPAEASNGGADYIVVGRPILQPPSGLTPVEAVRRIREELNSALAPGSIVDKKV